MAQSTIIKVKNNTGATIPSGRAVYLSGYDSTAGVSTIALSSYDNEATMPAVGVTRDEIVAGEIGIVKTNGLLAGLDTSSVSESAEVYVGLNGVLIFTDPFNISLTTISQQIATVAYSASEDRGQIFLFPLEIKRRVRHPDLLDVAIDQHHNKAHAEMHRPESPDQFIHAVQHAQGGGDEISHHTLIDFGHDDHPQYSLIDGSRSFTGRVGGIDPISSADLATKSYVDGLLGPGSFGVSEVTFNQNKKFWNDSLASIRKDADGYQTQIAGNNTTETQHYKQLSNAITTIRKDADGYQTQITGYNTTETQHYKQLSNAITTIKKDLDGYSSTSGVPEITFQQNKKFWNDAIYNLRIAADGYSGSSGGISEITFNQTKAGYTRAFQDVRSACDGYASNITVSEHYRQHSQAIKDIISVLDGYAIDTGLSETTFNQNKKFWNDSVYYLNRAADGYASDVTVSEHYRQCSNAIQTILKSLDGYSSSSGDASDITVSEHYRQHSTAIQTIRKDLDGYASDITVSEHYRQHSGTIQDILKSLDGYGSGTGTGDITGSGADGYVTYWTGEKTISGDGNLYYDSVDGYLGIGTQEPNERLTVSQGAISIEAIADAPAQEPNFGKLYVTFDGKLMFVREDGEKIDLTAFTGDIDGGSFFDTFIATNDIDAGNF